jgi:hypothetical protein
LFADEYSLFWESEPADPRVPELLVKLLEQVVATQRAEGSNRLHLASVSIVVPGPGGLEEREQQFSGATTPWATAFTQLRQFLTRYWSAAVSVHGELTSPAAAPIFGLWTDTMATPPLRRETGVTATYGTMEPVALSALLLNSSPYAQQLTAGDVAALVQQAWRQYGL